MAFLARNRGGRAVNGRWTQIVYRAQVDAAAEALRAGGPKLRPPANDPLPPGHLISATALTVWLIVDKISVGAGLTLTLAAACPSSVETNRWSSQRLFLRDW